MKRKNIHKILSLFFSLALAAGSVLSAVSCVEEEFARMRDEEGEALVSLRLELPEMTPSTRSLTDEQASAVNNIWIGIYDARPEGLLKDQFYFEVNHDDRHMMHKLEGLKTTLGASYIVAVANAGDNYGMSSDPEVAPQDGHRTNLLELLRKANTFGKYKSIAVALQSPSTVEYTEANVVMSGAYSEPEGGIHPGNSKVMPVYIPRGKTTLTGSIHLRRVISQVNFNITAAENITFRPLSWRVANNPRMSFLQEREDNDADGYTNAGDAITGHISDASTIANYGSSVPQTEIEGSSAGGYSFSFYTFENKRTGNASSYDDREKEYKNADGSNTGIYVALCGESMEKPDVASRINLNNFATFVEITCEVSYVANGIQRTGTAVYVVHLGYMNGDAADFNVRRNFRYTYSMKIFGLNQIVLEAEGTGPGAEIHPGLEGSVVDATEKIVTVDAHYGVYNISLSNLERTHLHYSIEAPYGGEVKKYEGGFIGGSIMTNERNNEYYNWVRIKPAPAANVFAEYKTSATDEPWYLDDLLDLDAYPGYDGIKDKSSEMQQWYTVFINENVYDTDGLDVHPPDDWVNFVNQDRMRSVLLLVQDVNVSEDTESRYSKGKYLIRQRPVQTYYSLDLSNYSGSATALGVEHINESYGKNIDWRWAAAVSSPEGTDRDKTVLSNRNGRWNLWKFLNNATNANSNSFSGSGTAERKWYCENTLDRSSRINTSYGLLRYVDDRGTESNKRTGYMKADEEGYAVPALAAYTVRSGSRVQDPQDNVGRYYEAAALCMSRNRDLNGDGKISPDELRWYLPAEGKYERIMLGRNSLQTPLFSFSNGIYYTNPNDEIAEEHKNWGYDGAIGTGNDNQVQFISSDHRKFFPEEGGSYHDNVSIWWQGYNESSGRFPWNVRCVRNLGVDLNTVYTDPNVDPVDKAYSYDKENRVFDMTHYYGNSLRAAIDTYIGVHSVLDLDKNKTPRKLKVAKEECQYAFGTVLDDGSSYDSAEDALNANVPCRDYSEADDGGAAWRTPNQRELMMMCNEDMGAITDRYFLYSCTKEGYGTKMRFSVAYNTNTSMQTPGNVSIVVRCVRDLE